MKQLGKYKIGSFFPVRLLVDQVRLNTALVGLWILLLVMIFGGVGKVYGIHYLFLDPEYLHEVGFMSFWWVGLALGNFIMAFQITSYILIGHRYSFIAVLNRPFTSFCINNLLFPLLFFIIYAVKIIWFHWFNPASGTMDILVYLLGLFIGVILMILLVMSYLRLTNRDIFRYLVGTVDRKLRSNLLSRERIMQRYKESRTKDHKVKTFLSDSLRIRSSAKLTNFPDRLAILKVFDQNHFNGVVFEVVLILVLLMLGLLVEKPWAQIPASASAMLLFSMMTMLIGSVTYWFRGWGIPIVLLLFILVNMISRTGYLSSQHAAIGLDYAVAPATYSTNNLDAISNPETFTTDQANLINTLENWRSGYPDSVKPKLNLLCVSGGGQRAALWTVAALQAIDKNWEGAFFDDVFSITGASGGMIGASYYRELYLQHKIDSSGIYDNEEILDNIGKDNLNPLIFSLISNDIFLDIKKFQFQDQMYFADRGILFEDNLNRNLEGIFTRNLYAYKHWEAASMIPMIILSPVISNDGRRLYISSSPINYMTQSSHAGYTEESLHGVDFNKLFKQQRSDSLTMLSALRMSASFPYITPTISLPSTPSIEVMDAGIADNFGISDALHIAHVAKDWINENTTGVVLLSIRDTKKKTPIEPKANPSLIHRFAYPISSVYNNLSNIQDVRNDRLIAYARTWLEVPIHPIQIEYDAINLATTQEKTLLEQNQLSAKEVARASLSWHLTEQEKQNILNYLQADHNRAAFDSLLSIQHQ